MVSVGVVGYEGRSEESGVFALRLGSVGRYVTDGRRTLRRIIARVHQDGHWRDGIHRVCERRPDALSSGSSSACRRGGRGRLRIRLVRRRRIHESPAHASSCFFLSNTTAHSAGTVVLGGRVVHSILVLRSAGVLTAPFPLRVRMRALR